MNGFSFCHLPPPISTVQFCTIEPQTRPTVPTCTRSFNRFRSIRAEQCDFCPTVTNLPLQEKSICPVLHSFRRIQIWIMFQHIVFASPGLKNCPSLSYLGLKYITENISRVSPVISLTETKLENLISVSLRTRIGNVWQLSGTKCERSAVVSPSEITIAKSLRPVNDDRCPMSLC